MVVFVHVTSYFLGEWVPRGNFEGVTNIVTGENILGGIGEVVLNTAGDALGGVGAGALVSNTAKGAAKEGSKVAIKEALKKQATKEAAKAFVPVVVMANMPKKDSRRKMGRRFKRKRTNNEVIYTQPDRQPSREGENNGGGDRDDEGQGSDEEWSDEDSESTTDESETEESSEEESSEEDQCQAMRSDGTPCTR